MKYRIRETEKWFWVEGSYLGWCWNKLTERGEYSPLLLPKPYKTLSEAESAVRSFREKKKDVIHDVPE